MKRVGIFVGLLMGLTLTGFPGGFTPALSQVLEQTFSESLADFKISSPNPKWSFAPRSITPGPIRATLRFFSVVDRFVPNVTVQVMALPEPAPTLQEKIKQEISNLPPGFAILEQRSFVHRGQEGYELHMENEDQGLDFLQWIFIAKNKSFIITCTTKTSTWPRFFPDFKNILNSFEIR